MQPQTTPTSQHQIYYARPLMTDIRKSAQGPTPRSTNPAPHSGVPTQTPAPHAVAEPQTCTHAATM
eukprot:12159162-Alexandrium_andersonii.AAC.1